MVANLPRRVAVPNLSIPISTNRKAAPVGADETAFMGREAPFLFSVDAIWDDPAETDEVIAYSREFLAAMEAHSPGGLYVNFAGFGV